MLFYKITEKNKKNKISHNWGAHTYLFYLRDFSSDTFWAGSDKNNPLPHGSSYLYSSCFSWLKAGQRSLCPCFKNFNSSRIHPRVYTHQQYISVTSLMCLKGQVKTLSWKKRKKRMPIRALAVCLLCVCQVFFIFLFSVSFLHFVKK